MGDLVLLLRRLAACLGSRPRGLPMQCLGMVTATPTKQGSLLGDPPARSASAPTPSAAGSAPASSRTVRDAPTAAGCRRGGRAPGAPPRAPPAGDALSARNRFPGVVRSVEVDGVMALVEIEAGPHLMTAAVTRDAVEELGLAPGVPATAAVKATSVMVERGREMRRGAALLALASALRPAGCGDDEESSASQAAPHGLGRHLAHQAPSRTTAKAFEPPPRASASPAPTSWPPRSARA